jgi:hypothetical protein
VGCVRAGDVCARGAAPARELRSSCARRCRRRAALRSPAPGLSLRNVMAAAADDAADAAAGGDSFAPAHALVAATAVSSAHSTT